MADLGRNRIVVGLLFIACIGLLVSAPVAGVTQQEIYDKFCVPGYNACTKSLCNPTTSGCAGPCIDIYQKPCFGECGNYAQSPTCVEPYWSGFMGCLGSCKAAEKPAICAEACQHALEVNMRECLSALKAGGTGTPGPVAGNGSTHQPVTPIAASFTATPVSGIAPLTATFTDTSQGSPVSRSWNFGDGTSGNANVMIHEYRIPGSYRVSLTVTGSTRETSVAYQTITVNSAPLRVPEPDPVPPIVPLVPPDAAIAANPDSGPAPLKVRFTDTSSGTVSGWIWEFEPGYKSEQPAANHTYRNPGTYIVKLTVSGAGGIDTSTITIRVTDPLPSGGGGGGTQVDNTGGSKPDDGSNVSGGSARDPGTSSIDTTTPPPPPATEIPDSALAAGAGVAGAAAAGAQAIRKRRPPDSEFTDEEKEVEINFFPPIEKRYIATLDSDLRSLYENLRFSGFSSSHSILDSIKDKTLPLKEVKMRVTLGLDAVGKGYEVRDDLRDMILGYAPIIGSVYDNEAWDLKKDLGTEDIMVLSGMDHTEKGIIDLTLQDWENKIDLDKKLGNGIGGFCYNGIKKVVGYLNLPSDLEKTYVDIEDAAAAREVYIRFVQDYDKYKNKTSWDVWEGRRNIKDYIIRKNKEWQIHDDIMNNSSHTSDEFIAANANKKVLDTQIRDAVYDFTALNLRFNMMNGK